MSDLRELYQQLIIDHGRHPRNFCECKNANHQAEGFNPLCGDKLTVYCHIEHDRITDVSFKGDGCAISMASASLMTEALKGKTVSEANKFFEKFHSLVTKDADNSNGLGKLSILSGVREFPMRVKCATLAWHTLHAALENTQAMVTTE